MSTARAAASTPFSALKAGSHARADGPGAVSSDIDRWTRPRAGAVGVPGRPPDCSARSEPGPADDLGLGTRLVGAAQGKMPTKL